MDEMQMRRAIERKREGETLEQLVWESMVAGYMNGEIDDAQMASLAMACVWRGLTVDEAAALTAAMVASGATLSYPDDMFVVDKHSSGGVSDIVSLVAVPLVAACGVPVAKLSGRALGHTGGTVDKLETIPGFNVAPSMDAFVRQVESVGCAIAAQTESFVPADRRMYKLRDRTATVPSLGLIASSIVSKKVAGGAKGFVFDVKCGSAAFMRDPESATALARALVDISARFGRASHAVVTDMNEPLGHAIGTGIEVIEARNVLRGIDNDGRAREGCIRIASEMLEVAGVADTRRTAEAALDDGRAYERFCLMIEAQGGSVAGFEAMEPNGDVRDVCSANEGYISSIDAVALGNIGRALSAREAHSGLRTLVRVGDRVARDQPVARIHGSGVAEDVVAAAFAISPEAPNPHALVYAIV
jgi:pyrimidine-nucleoside phosphorylase